MVLAYLDNLSKLMKDVRVTDARGEALTLGDGVEEACRLLAEGFFKDAYGENKIMVVGNGGSAAIASHIQNDLCANFHQAMVFTEQPLLTGLANDHGWQAAYECLVKLWGHSGDLLWTISSSGESKNIIRALHQGRKSSCHLITFSGFEPTNRSRGLGHLNFYVPSHVYAEVESVHTVLAHYITTAVK